RFDEFAVGIGEGPRVSADDHSAGDGVAGAVGDQLRARDDDRVEGVDIARDDGLQGQDELGADDHGVDDEVRGRSVPAPAGNADLEVVLRGHDRSAARVDLTGGQAGNVVQSVDLIDGEPVEQSIGDHRLGAGSRLLRRLEDQADGAVEGDVG